MITSLWLRSKMALLGMAAIFMLALILGQPMTYSKRKPRLASYVPPPVYQLPEPNLFFNGPGNYGWALRDTPEMLGIAISGIIKGTWYDEIMKKDYMTRWWSDLWHQIPYILYIPGWDYPGFSPSGVIPCICSNGPIWIKYNYYELDPVSRFGHGRYYLGWQCGRFIVPSQVRESWRKKGPHRLLELLGGNVSACREFLDSGVHELTLLEQSCVPDAPTAEKLALEYKSETEGWLPGEAIQGITLYRKTRPRAILEGRGADEFIWVVRFGRKPSSYSADLAALTQEYWIDARSGLVRAILPPLTVGHADLTIPKCDLRAKSFDQLADRIKLNLSIRTQGFSTLLSWVASDSAPLARRLAPETWHDHDRWTLGFMFSPFSPIGEKGWITSQAFYLIADIKEFITTDLFMSPLLVKVVDQLSGGSPNWECARAAYEQQLCSGGLDGRRSNPRPDERRDRISKSPVALPEKLFVYIYMDTALSHDDGVPLLWMTGPICTVWLVELGRDVPGFGVEGDLVWIASQPYNPTGVYITLDPYPYLYRQVWVNAMNGKMFSILSADPYEVARRVEVSDIEGWRQWLMKSVPDFHQEF